jgi:hypothetical protein
MSLGPASLERVIGDLRLLFGQGYSLPRGQACCLMTKENKVTGIITYNHIPYLVESISLLPSHYLCWNSIFIKNSFY